jgi:5-methylcytosine-specific restriction protein B
MDFCIKNCNLSRWEDFDRYKMFLFSASYPFNRAELHFKKNHVSVFLRMDAGVDVAEMSEVLCDKLGLRPEIRTQSGDTMTALHPKFETEEECDALVKWLSDEVAKQRAIDFSWEPIHLELVEHLRKYEGRQDELLRVIKLMQVEELPTISLEDNAEGTLELAELDPFTFIGNMNRPIKDSYKIRMWEIIKEEFKLNSEVPKSFIGLPRLNLQKSKLFWSKPERTDSDIPNLWKFFHHILDTPINAIDHELMDECLNIKGVGMGYLTMAMFWVRPEKFLSADKNNLSKALRAGVNLPTNNAVQYLSWLENLHQKIDGDTIGFSAKAHYETVADGKQKRAKSKELGAPFNDIFQSLDEAKEVLEIFRKTILWLQDDEKERQQQLVVGVLKKNNLRLYYGSWLILSYNWQNDTLVTLENQLVEKELQPKWDSFKEQIDNQSFGIYEVQFADYEALEISNKLEDSARKIGGNFAEWQSSPYKNYHNSVLYELILNEDKREEILRKGLPTSTLAASSKACWLIAPGEGAELWEKYQKEGIISIGWAQSGDLSLLSSKKDIIDELEKEAPERSSTQSGKMLFDFAHSMEPGDYVFTKEGRRSVLGWGIITSDYTFQDDGERHPHIRKVEWKSSEKVEMPDEILLPLKTLTRYEEGDELVEFLSECYFADKEIETVQTLEYTRKQALEDLFIEEVKFDRIISTLKRKKNIVLQGAPGTGKTYIAKRLAYSLMETKDDGRVAMVQFHQSTNYEDFIQGFRPNEDGQFELRNGIFYDFCEKAKGSPDDYFVFIIDEINRGNLSKVFGELMMLIEPDKRDKRYGMPLTYSSAGSEEFYVPDNLYLIGTMNTADKSLSLVDYALRRRFAFLEMDPGFDSAVFAEVLSKKGLSEGMIEKIKATMNELNQKIEKDSVNLGRGFRIGHSFFVTSSKVVDEQKWFDEIISFEIAPLLEEYWMDDPSALDSAKGIIGLGS